MRIYTYIDMNMTNTVLRSCYLVWVDFASGFFGMFTHWVVVHGEESNATRTRACAWLHQLNPLVDVIYNDEH